MDPSASGGASKGVHNISNIHRQRKIFLTGNASPDHDALHRRFRALIMLLFLVSAINYKGRPLFSATVDKPYIAPVDEDGQSARNRLLNCYHYPPCAKPWLRLVPIRRIWMYHLANCTFFFQFSF